MGGLRFRTHHQNLCQKQKYGGNMHAQGKIGDISATGYPIHFTVCSRVGFSGTAD